MQKLELLSPAKNLEYGIAAINHGADAVYIGSGKFGARKAASNSMEDIEQLTVYAHRYNASVYIALNTILFDNELDEAREIIGKLWNAGADALIIQDMGLLEMDLPPIPLFASTQTDNRSPEHVRFLANAGFERVILARELSLDEISAIRKVTTVELEAFVHGSLCVGYSGRCYLSASMGGRSSNRGACGQPCRLPWTLTSADGFVIEKNRHLLSLKDMNRSDHLTALTQAGITSFKIEGRLKDISYLKNITALYRKRLDLLLEESAGYIKASSGATSFFFTPSPSKTFNRGETDYLLTGRKGEIHSFDTPKSLGEKLGTVKNIEVNAFTLNQNADIHNGDGLCYFDRDRRLAGIQVNRMDKGRIFVSSRNNLLKSALFSGATIYRNHDHQFLKTLSGKTAQRRIALDLRFYETEAGFALSGKDEDGNTSTHDLTTEKVLAEKKEGALSTIRKQLLKTGDSIFSIRDLQLETAPWFIRTSLLNQIRRELLETLLQKRESSYIHPHASGKKEVEPYPLQHLDFTANISNQKAETFYRNHSVETIMPAFEIQKKITGADVMISRHCIKKALDYCPKDKKRVPESWKEPLFILVKGNRFKVTFDCIICEMKITAT